MMNMPKANFFDKFKLWFFEGIKGSGAIRDQEKAPWWKVMCLTGVDYFSTLGYQPGIAFLAAGALSPMATLVLVFLTLFGALPIYRRVAVESPHGQGSIAMLANLLSGWHGKLVMLGLLGFACTDFMITMTLSAADAAAHVVQNPLAPSWLQDNMTVTLSLLIFLAAIFLMGFREAIGVSFVLVVIYLILSLIVIAVSAFHIFQNPVLAKDWLDGLFVSHGSVGQMLLISLVLFPKLALGLSGFETGVAVMPLVFGDKADSEEKPIGRIRNTKKLLTTAALIMSFYLVSSSLVTTILIPPQEFASGGSANGRALSYLGHEYLGYAFGTGYDLSSIAILWFAGASAMAGLLNLVPRYLPRFGMAPEWARANRPLVVFFSLVAFAITIYFKADVDAQGGAYATGVLVLMTSAAVAVTFVVWRESTLKRLIFCGITAIFIYTSLLNMYERPDGLHISLLFIAIITFTSMGSRMVRSTELRIKEVELDHKARQFIEESSHGVVRFVAHKPGKKADYRESERLARLVHNLEGNLIFLEVKLTDASEFSDDLLEVKGIEKGPFRILQCASPAIPNAIAALLLHVRNKTKKKPHIYMGWTEGNPLLYVLRFVFLGDGETAAITREVLRAAEPDIEERPFVHVG